MIAHARLVVIGGDSQRLHEEIITAGGYLKEGRFSRMNVGAGRRGADGGDRRGALGGDEGAVPEALGRHRPLAPASPHGPHGRPFEGLEKRLLERADKEAGDIESILLELKRAIETELGDSEYQQLELFSDPEREQFERNKDFLKDRVKQIPAEIERETAAIRARFADPQARMFPVAVTFLVPRKMAMKRDIH